MKNILLMLHEDDGQEARLQVALDLVRGLDGHLTGVDIVAVPAFVGDYIAVGGSALLLGEERERESANRSRIQERLSHEDVSFDLIDTSGDPALCLRDAAVLTDLIVVNRKLDGVWFPDMQEIASELILKSGKAVMAVPQAAKGLDVTGPVLIAWDGSDSAEAAMRAAVPLLALSASVTIVEVGDRTLRAPAAEAAQYLSRHGIHALVRHEDALTEHASGVIQRLLTEQPVAYLVMGGFGHARWLESVFGGVTRRMLMESPVPVFFAH